MSQKNTRATHNESGTKKIMLVCPPFHHPGLSSIAVAQLATWLRINGVECEEAYFHLELQRIIGAEVYAASVERRKGNVAELLFAEALHGSVSATYEAQLTTFFGPRQQRDEITRRFAAQCLQRVELSGADIVGFTTSYNQLSASLFLADDIKKKTSAMVVMGGNPCNDVMGQALLRAYPFVDYVISGYGEAPLIDLAKGGLPSERLIESPHPPALQDAPLPDYRHFVREAAEYGMDVTSKVNLQYQSSRGCWWGEKRHCTFCGLHRSHLLYEAKSTDRVVSDIRTLYERYGQTIMTTDAVLSLEHLRNAIPRLSQFQQKPWLFYELKANVSERDIVALSKCQIIVQMGIESLSTRLMKQMQKGSTAIRAVAALKWSQERRLNVKWNLLYGIPGETVADYQEQIALIKKIPHLIPARILGPIHIDRYSPYFDRYAEFGWTAIHPAPEYKEAHPHVDEQTLFDLAYHFEGEGDNREVGYFDDLQVAFDEWHARYKAGDGLFLGPIQGVYRVVDGEETGVSLNDMQLRIIGATHEIVSIKKLVAELGCSEEVILQMAREDLLFIENNRVLNLTVRTELPD